MEEINPPFVHNRFSYTPTACQRYVSMLPNSERKGTKLPVRVMGERAVVIVDDSERYMSEAGTELFFEQDFGEETGYVVGWIAKSSTSECSEYNGVVPLHVAGDLIEATFPGMCVPYICIHVHITIVR